MTQTCVEPNEDDAWWPLSFSNLIQSVCAIEQTVQSGAGCLAATEYDSPDDWPALKNNRQEIYLAFEQFQIRAYQVFNGGTCVDHFGLRARC